MILGTLWQKPASRLESRYDTIAGWRMHCWVGAGAPDALPIVLVHGLGVSGAYMLPLAHRLVGHHAVYVPDLPGFGKSAKPRQVLTTSELADVLALWMERVGLARAVLIGNSYGCQIIAELAVRHPERVLRAVLQGPTIDPYARTTVQQLGRLLRDSLREPDVQPLIVLRDYLICGPRRYLGTFRNALRHPMRLRLTQIQAPTLIVHGARDPIVSRRWVEEAARLLPCGRLVVIPAAPHTVNYAAPNAFARALRPFLNAAARLEQP